MTVIQASGAVFQVVASAPKKTTFGAMDNSNSFAALLDEQNVVPEFPASANLRSGFPGAHLIQPAVQNPVLYLATTVSRGSGHGFQDAAAPSAPVTAAALPIANSVNVSAMAPNEPNVEGERHAKTVSLPSLPPAKIADASEPVPANAAGFHLQKQPKLFAFSELGMFGRHGAQFSAAAELRIAPSNENNFGPRASASPTAQRDTVYVETRIQPERADDHVPELRPASQTAQRINTEFVPPGATSQMSAPLAGAPQNQDVPIEEPVSGEVRTGATVFEFANAEPAAAAHSSSPFENEAVPAEDRGAPVFPPELPESRALSPINLVVSGPGNALMIVARSSDAEPATLRRLAESTAAEFGMNVTEVRINGSAVEPSLASGGNHGRRAR